nr:unnamed protein product [Callosobruchus chinensis]
MTMRHRRFRIRIVSQFCLSLFPITNFQFLGGQRCGQEITGAPKL